MGTNDDNKNHPMDLSKKSKNRTDDEKRENFLESSESLDLNERGGLAARPLPDLIPISNFKGRHQSASSSLQNSSEELPISDQCRGEERRNGIVYSKYQKMRTIRPDQLSLRQNIVPYTLHKNNNSTSFNYGFANRTLSPSAQQQRDELKKSIEESILNFNYYTRSGVNYSRDGYPAISGEAEHHVQRLSNSGYFAPIPELNSSSSCEFFNQNQHNLQNPTNFAARPSNRPQFPTGYCTGNHGISPGPAPANRNNFLLNLPNYFAPPDSQYSHKNAVLRHAKSGSVNDIIHLIGCNSSRKPIDENNYNVFNNDDYGCDISDVISCRGSYGNSNRICSFSNNKNNNNKHGMRKKIIANSINSSSSNANNSNNNSNDNSNNNNDDIGIVSSTVSSQPASSALQSLSTHRRVLINHGPAISDTTMERLREWLEKRKLLLKSSR